LAAPGDGAGTTGTTSGATRSSTILPDNNRPSAPSGDYGRGQGPSSSIGTTGVNGPGSGAGGGTGAPGGGTGGAGGGTGSWTGKSR
jgi:zinc finger protein ZIC 2